MPTEMWMLKDFKIQITEKTIVEKGEIALNEQFHLFPQCFPIFFFSLLTFSQTSCGFTCLLYKSFENALGKGEIACNTCLENFIQFSLNLKLSSANCFSLGVS